MKYPFWQTKSLGSKLHVLLISCPTKLGLLQTLWFIPSLPKPRTTLLHRSTFACPRCLAGLKIIVYHDLAGGISPTIWKILEFINWDGDNSQYIYIYIGKNKTCSKPPASYINPHDQLLLWRCKSLSNNLIIWVSQKITYQKGPKGQWFVLIIIDHNHSYPIIILKP